MCALVPRTYMTEEHLVSTFKIFSRLGALIESLWAEPNSTKYVPLFLSVHGPAYLHEVDEHPTRDTCLYGPFGRRFLEQTEQCSG